MNKIALKKIGKNQTSRDYFLLFMVNEIERIMETLNKDFLRVVKFHSYNIPEI